MLSNFCPGGDTGGWVIWLRLERGDGSQGPTWRWRRPRAGKKHLSFWAVGLKSMRALRCPLSPESRRSTKSAAMYSTGGGNPTPLFHNRHQGWGRGTEGCNSPPSDCAVFLEDLLCLLARPELETGNFETWSLLREGPRRYGRASRPVGGGDQKGSAR